MKEPISVAFACDESYAKHVAVVIKSIFAKATLENEYEFHILTMGLTPETANRLQKLVSNCNGTLQIHHIAQEKLANFPASRHTLNAYLRLFLAELLPVKDKILYLDADLIVFDSLNKLWHHPLGNYAVAAAVDSTACFVDSASEHLGSLNLPIDHQYFNSGVLLLNLRVLREIRLLEKVLVWTIKNSHLMLHSDQDALNALLAGKITYLHLRWNLQVPLIDPVRFGWGCIQVQGEAVADPAIIHYVTGRKPWLRQYKLPYQHLYFYYLAQTPWKDDPLSPYTFRQRLHRLSEELDWCYKWLRAEIRRFLGRHPEPVEESSLTTTSCPTIGLKH